MIVGSFTLRFFNLTSVWSFKFPMKVAYPSTQFVILFHSSVNFKTEFQKSFSWFCGIKFDYIRFDLTWQNLTCAASWLLHLRIFNTANAAISRESIFPQLAPLSPIVLRYAKKSQILRFSQNVIPISLSENYCCCFPEEWGKVFIMGKQKKMRCKKCKKNFQLLSHYYVSSSYSRGAPLQHCQFTAIIASNFRPWQCMVQCAKLKI